MKSREFWSERHKFEVKLIWMQNLALSLPMCEKLKYRLVNLTLGLSFFNCEMGTEQISFHEESVNLFMFSEKKNSISFFFSLNLHKSVKFPGCQRVTKKGTVTSTTGPIPVNLILHTFSAYMFPSELATLRFTGILVIFSDVGKFFA
jgi:hypothetical protein